MRYVVLVISLALLAGCVPIPDIEPPAPDPAPQMQANVDNFAAVFAKMEHSLQEGFFPAEEYKAAILELRDCLMALEGPHKMTGLSDGELAAIQWHIIYVLMLNYQFEEDGLIIDHLRTALTDCQENE